MFKKYLDAFVSGKYATPLILTAFLSCAALKSLSADLFNNVTYNSLWMYISYVIGSILPYLIYAFVLANVISRRLSRPLDFKKSLGIVSSSLFPIPLAHALQHYFRFTNYPYWGDLIAVLFISLALKNTYAVSWKGSLAYAISTYVGLVLLCVSFYGFKA